MTAMLLLAGSNRRVGGLWLHLGHGPLILLTRLFGGIAAWIAGHLTYAYRDGVWRSRLALQIFRLPGLQAVRPATM